ncbi:MAG TPA: ergothioneine biosynthesis protein EgtC [Acidimicrobiales bacterium]|nr:ergothioneine biosynthesis protein EgtC [Acidimicrobiales bacterium]
MCRFLAYVGPPVRLDALLLAPPHSLLRQSWAPRMQTHGVVNADGFGVGWYDHAVRPEPAVYRSARPMWSDRNLPSFGPMVASGAVLAAVRSATPPSPVEESAAPPFTSGRWLFAHNGAVVDLAGVGPALRRALSDRRLAGIVSPTDAELLFAMVLDRLDSGAAPAAALAEVVGIVRDGRMNLVLTDGVRVAAVAWGESLFTRSAGSVAGSEAGSGSVVVASEPYDDGDDWQAVPDTSVVSATAGSLTVEAL